MGSTRRFPLAWVAIYGAIVGATGFIPLIPYVTGGGFLPLSISLSAISPLILGFPGGILAALIGGLIGMFINPATYPFGLLDAFLIGMAPALFCGLAFKSAETKYRIGFVSVILVGGFVGEAVPYYLPGAGFDGPPTTSYLLLVAIFFLPWLLLYLLPVGPRYLAAWLRGGSQGKRMASLVVGSCAGLLVWSLYVIAPAALTLNWAQSLAFATWIFGLWSRIALGIIAAIIAMPLLAALSRSGMPAPGGAFWGPGNASGAEPTDSARA